MAKQEKKAAFTVLRSAPPPWHAVSLVVLLTALVGQSLLSAFRTIDQVADLSTFAKRLFPEYVSLELLIAVRAAFAFFIFGLSWHMIQFGGWVQVTPWLPQSKLKRAEYRMYGFRTQAPFTVWSWNLLGLSNAINAWLAYQTKLPQPLAAPPVWLLRTGVLLFEIVGPCAMLVSFVVKYALWPQILKHGTLNDPTAPLKTLRALIMHNVNVVMVLTEISLLGGLPIRPSDFGGAALYGIVYVLFTWSTMSYWAPPQHGPQALYFFFDTTLGATTSLAIVILLLVLMGSYGLFYGLHRILDHLEGGIMIHLLAVVFVAAMVCRFRD